MLKKGENQKVLPTIEEAIHELELASSLNPGPWVKHSINVGIAARNIAEKIPEMNPQKAYIYSGNNARHRAESRHC